MLAWLRKQRWLPTLAVVLAVAGIILAVFVALQLGYVLILASITFAILAGKEPA